jgi:two-component system CheB/CheR fusion protein
MAHDERMTTTPEQTRDLNAVLEHLRRSRGFDFSGYKRTTLERRLQKRMQAVNVDSYAEYLSVLEANPDEFTRLFDTVLINVTRFFRDGAPWEYVSTEIIPKVVAAKRPNDTIRVWSAGCATGEEAYTLAMVFAEALGVDEFRRRVKIYATDLDEGALAVARQAAYGDRDVAEIPPELRERYFDRQEQSYVFQKDLRRNVIFGRNDLIQDAPISRIDLLVCRNTLMYFDAPTQARILARFHFALCDTGFLVLGRAETLLTQASAFTPVDLKRRIFAKVPRPPLRDRLIISAQAGTAEMAAELATAVRLRDAAFDGTPMAQIVVDRGGALALANERARLLFDIATSDIGRPLQDLEVSYRPAELRSLLERAYAEGRTVALEDVQWRTAGIDERWMSVRVVPLSSNGEGFIGASITFADVGASRRLQQQLEESRHNLETAYEELQATNEELETTNEELQSTVEELETTNEELQSSNEELETMNEELQAANEELQTMNEEFRLRGEELTQVNAFLEAVFASLRRGVAVLDRDLKVMIWNSDAEELWGLRASEAQGESFSQLDIGLPVHDLLDPVRAALAGNSPAREAVVPAVNRRGRSIQCRVTCAPFSGGPGGHPRGVILLMEELPP